MLTIDEAHEAMNGRFEESVPQEGDVAWWPNPDIGIRFVYRTDHWEHEEQTE